MENLPIPVKVETQLAQPQPINIQTSVPTENLPTPVKVDKFANYLEGYPMDKKQRLIDGFVNGFRIGYEGEVICTSCDNLKSARDRYCKSKDRERDFSR